MLVSSFDQKKKVKIYVLQKKESNTVFVFGEYMMTEFSFFGWATHLNLFCPMISFKII